MTTLRQAAQQALEAWDTRAGIDTASKAFEALRAALAEQPAEPQDPDAYNGWVLREVLFDNGEPVGHREPTKAEPVDAGWSPEARTQVYRLESAVRMMQMEAAAPEAPAQGDLSAEANAEGFESVAAYVAYLKRAKDTYFAERNSARDAARRNREAHEWQYTMAGERLRRIEKDEALLRQALEALEWIVTGRGHDTVETTHAAIRTRLGEAT